MSLIVPFLCTLVLLATMCTCSPRQERYWPLSNMNHDVNLGQSSPFGPRLKISEDERYDFHRGVDIPTPFGSDVYAIDDGRVRIPGLYHNGYGQGMDGVVQLVHTGWNDEGDLTKRYYSNYLHLSQSFLENMNVGDFVPKGTLIGLTGETNDFPHLHFEIRAGTLFQGHACNPWKFLPCPHCGDFTANISVTFIALEETDGGCTALTQVSLPPDQLTFAAVQLTVTGGESEYDKTVDLCEANIHYTNTPFYAPLRMDDNTVIPDLVINPHFFNSESYENNHWSTVDYNFLNLPAVENGQTAEVTVTVYDIFGGSVEHGPVHYSSPCNEV